MNNNLFDCSKYYVNLSFEWVIRRNYFTTKKYKFLHLSRLKFILYSIIGNGQGQNQHQQSQNQHQQQQQPQQHEHHHQSQSQPQEGNNEEVRIILMSLWSK